MRALALRLGAASLAVMFFASASMAQRMERGAFLRKPANSRAQLLAQVEADPIVAKRYQRHFGMTEDQVHRYFTGMSSSTLPNGGKYLVWHVDPNGVMETKWLTLKKGTKVFVDKTGRIALKMNCGNPLIDSTVAKKTIEVAFQPPPAVPIETFVSTPPPVVEVVPPPAVIVPEVEALAPPPPVVLAAPPIIPPAVPIAPSVGGGGFSPWPLLLLGGALLGGGGGGGGGSPPPVPEPATMVALGAGLAMIVRRRQRKQA